MKSLAIIGLIVVGLAALGYVWFEYIRPNPYPEADGLAPSAARHMKLLAALQEDFLRATSSGQPPDFKKPRFGTLREVAANSHMNLGYAWKSDNSAELHEYCITVFRPEPPDGPLAWAAVAWGQGVGSAAGWHACTSCHTAARITGGRPLRSAVVMRGSFLGRR